MKRLSKGITIRFTAEMHEKLTRFANSKNISIGEAARRILDLYLGGDAPIQKVEERLGEVTSRLSELKEDMSLVTRVLLVSSGNVSRAEADEWVELNLG